MTMTVRRPATLSRSPLDHELPPAVPAEGRDDLALDALAGVSIDVPDWPVLGGDGPVGLWQVERDAHPHWARSPTEARSRPGSRPPR
jgi:hypothetical protein